MVSCPASSRASSSSDSINLRIRWAARWQASTRFAIFGGAALAVQRGLGLRQHHGNRRAQFVRGVGGELLLLGKRGFQPGEGGIQNGGEPAEFAFGLGDVDALRQIAGGNFHGGRR